MRARSIKVHYLFHSGFAVETENHFLIFDYYNDSADNGIRTLSNGVIGDDDIASHKNILVFCSHSHSDHYNPVILNWVRINPNIKYILSDDIKIKENMSIKKLPPYSEFETEDVNIRTYGSTDIGVSFMVSLDRIKIFHAGDLNWWYWLDDPSDEIEKAERLFKAEMEKMDNEPVDIAFFPVDPRLGEKYYLGGEYFIKKLHPGYFIPMHFGDNPEITKQFKALAKNWPSHVFEITKRGQEITLE